MAQVAPAQNATIVAPAQNATVAAPVQQQPSTLQNQPKSQARTGTMPGPLRGTKSFNRRVWLPTESLAGEEVRAESYPALARYDAKKMRSSAAEGDEFDKVNRKTSHEDDVDEEEDIGSVHDGTTAGSGTARARAAGPREDKSDGWLSKFACLVCLG